MRLTFLLALCAAGSLMAQEGYPESYPGLMKAPKTEKGKPVTEPERPAFDVHFLQGDEYLITEKDYSGGSGWERVFLAKMLTPATKETKGEAEFFIVAGGEKGEKKWTKHYALTRPATKEDVKLGAVLYHFDGGYDDREIYITPKDRETLLEHTWFVGSITDTSTLYKGFVSLSGYKCTPVGFRIALKHPEKEKK